jgi:deoxyribodipyrimidine photo-lyase
MPVNPRRIRVMRESAHGGSTVVYWMSRDQRVADNWALIFAADLARRHDAALAVVFCLVDDFLGATLRAYDFMLRGLEEVEAALARRDIPFLLLRGDPAAAVPACVRDNDAGWLVTDFDPLRIKRKWKREVVRRVDACVYEVDAHNIVPCRAASPKQEFAAYTLRPKIHRALPEYLDLFPRLTGRRRPFRGRVPRIDWDRVVRGLGVDGAVKPVRGIAPGERAARRALRRFLKDGLAHYPAMRNDPSAAGQSGLSPYIHFGQISAQRVAIEVEKARVRESAREAFLEELIVRRELSDNFCYYNRYYDSVRGFPGWAATTLKLHEADVREYLYSAAHLEGALTHDEIWNAAQRQMVERGKMHGYMRMYWAKKILEWTRSPRQALKIAIRLNDRYELDGRDPNGYTGMAWSIGGVHDRAWGERPVFGKVRYMSAKGIRSKVDIDAYVEKYGPRL